MLVRMPVIVIAISSVIVPVFICAVMIAVSSVVIPVFRFAVVSAALAHQHRAPQHVALSI